MNRKQERKRPVKTPVKGKEIGGNPLKRVQSVMIYLLLLALSFVYYGNSISNGYSLDDYLVTTTKKQRHLLVEQGVSGIGKIFRNRYAVDADQAYSYRPVTATTFALEWEFSDPKKPLDERASTSHLVNILLYALACMVLFRFLVRLMGEEKWFFALMVALIFLIHPIHSEVVNNIKGRDEMLAFLFAFSGGIYLLNFVDRRKFIYLIVCIVLLMLSVLSKGSGITALALLPLSLYFFRSIKPSVLSYLFAVGVGSLVIARVLKKILLDDHHAIRIYHYFENPLYESGFVDRIPAYFQSNLWYLKQLIVPYPLRYYYGYNQIEVASWGSIWFVAGILVTAGLLFIAYKGLRKKSIWAYSILFFLLAIGGACNLLVPMPGIVAERFAFFASAGFAIGLASAIFWVFKQLPIQPMPYAKATRVMLVWAILAIPCLIYGLDRNKAWQSELSLFREDAAGLKRSAKANSLLANTYYYQALDAKRTGNVDLYPTMLVYADSAFHHDSLCVSMYPRYSSSWNNMASNLYGYQLKIVPALQMIRKSIEADSTNNEALFNEMKMYGDLAFVFHRLYSLSQQDSLKDTLQQAISSSPANYPAQAFNSGLIRSALILALLENPGRSLIPSSSQLANTPVLMKLVEHYEKLPGSRFAEIQYAKVLSGVMKRQGLVAPTDLVAKQLWQELTDRMLAEGQIASVGHFGKLKEAYTDSCRSIAKQLNRVMPEYYPQYQFMEHIAMQLNDMDLLIETSRQRLKAVPFDAVRCYVNMANAFSAKGDETKAKDHFMRAREVLVKRLTNMQRYTVISSKFVPAANQLQAELNKLDQHLATLP